ncbi:MAG: zeta toxin family protein [Actinomycetota bacterium]|nr:zeta toxin family protein [Actinomycetota bacterium]HSH23789.1 zeta toxin family protein [Acidimicrobiales bacterium]
MAKTDQQHITITGQEYGLPYSKGLMASRIMATGLAPGPAFHVAQVVEDRLRRWPDATIPGPDLDELVGDVLREEVGESYATSYARWQRVTQFETPIVVLIGGATGVGKSTIATMLANRLGVTRVIPTDAIREVMRAMFSPELMPTLHTSSFDAARLVRHPLPRDADPVLIGFREQAGAIAVGVGALISRAVHEGTDLIVEGAHVVPGFLDLTPFEGRAVVVQLVVTVDDEDLHRSHFLIRARDARSRPAERYLELFGSIRKQHAYVKSLALEHAVPIVPSENLDVTLPRVIDLVFTQAVEAVPEQAVATPADSKRGAS